MNDNKIPLTKWLKAFKENLNIFTCNFFKIEELYSLYCYTKNEKDDIMSSFTRLIDSICRNSCNPYLRQKIYSQKRKFKKGTTENILINDNGFCKEEE